MSSKSAQQVSHENCPLRRLVAQQEQPEAHPAGQHMEARVGRLEGVVAQLTDDIKAVTQGVSDLGSEIGSLRDIISEKIEGVTDRVTSSQRPNWGTIAALITVVMTVMGLCGSLVAMVASGQSAAITECKQGMSEINRALLQAQYEKGKADAFMQQATQRLQDMNTQLADCVNLAKAAETQSSKNTEDIKDFRAWRLAFSNAVSEVQGRVSAKQLMIEDSSKRTDERVYRDLYDRVLHYELGHDHESAHDKPPAPTK